MPYLLALLCCLLFGVSEFLYKLAHREKLHEGSYLCLQSGTVFCTLGLLSAGGGGWRMTPAAAVLGIGCGMLAFCTAITFLISIGRGPASVTAAIRRLSFVITAALAVAILGERLTALKLFAIVLAGAGLVTIVWTPEEAHRPYPLIYVTVLSSGLLSFAHKLGAGAGVSPAAFLMFQAGIVHLCSHVLCRTTGGYRFSGWGIRLAPVTGVLLAVAMTLLLHALRTGEALVLIPLVQLSFLVTAPLSFRLLHEPMLPRKLLGLALGAAAVLTFGFAA